MSGISERLLDNADGILFYHILWKAGGCPGREFFNAFELFIIIIVIICYYYYYCYYYHYFPKLDFPSTEVVPEVVPEVSGQAPRYQDRQDFPSAQVVPEVIPKVSGQTPRYQDSQDFPSAGNPKTRIPKHVMYVLGSTRRSHI